MSAMLPLCRSSGLHAGVPLIGALLAGMLGGCKDAAVTASSAQAIGGEVTSAADGQLNGSDAAPGTDAGAPGDRGGNPGETAQPAKACPGPCLANDDCHAAHCDTTLSQCAILAKLDGAACEDGNVCTVDDKCPSGGCSAGKLGGPCGRLCVPQQRCWPTCSVGVWPWPWSRWPCWPC